MSLTVPDLVLGPWAKAFPPRLWGLPLSHVAGARARLSEFITPVLTLGTEALGHNERVVSQWSQDAGVLLAPHGKTTMSPALWQRLLAEGAWGLTLATPWQVEVAVDAGVQRILLANDLVDLQAARRFSEYAARGIRIIAWTDSLDGVARLARHGGPAPLELLVDVGGDGGRTGARTADEAVAVATAIAAEPTLSFAGVAGYEGPFGGTRADQGEVDAFLRTIAEVHERTAHLVAGTPIVSAGGSAWPDRVAEVLAPLEADVIVRSGAYQVHDDGLYGRESPFGRSAGSEPLVSAMHVFTRVVSHPEPDLALLDAGRRDVSYDIDLPTPQFVVGGETLTDARITGLNDQHAFLRTTGNAPAIGEVVRLGLSHPCTALDKWRVIVLIDDPDAIDPLVIGAVATCF